MGQCIASQIAKKIWGPAKPCCFPNTFFDPPSPPVRDGKTTCYHRMTKEQRLRFRHFVVNKAESFPCHKFQHKSSIRHWQRMLHPEQHFYKTQCPKRPKHSPIAVGSEIEKKWCRDGSCHKMISSATCLPGAEIFEGRSQVKATCRKRRPSEMQAAGNSSGSQRAGPNLVQKATVGDMAEGTLFHKGTNLKLELSKQSGVEGIMCHQASCPWVVEQKFFHVEHVGEPEKNYADADAAALKMIKNSFCKVSTDSLGVNWNKRGVDWIKRDQCWRVRLCKDGKKHHGGFFRPKDDTSQELERAWLAAVKRRKEMENAYNIIEKN